MKFSQRVDTRSFHGVLAAFAVSVAACTGFLGGPDGDGDPSGRSGSGAGGDDAGSGAVDPATLPPNPGAAPLRRLTNTEYDNTVADLLGDTTAPGAAFPGATTSTQGYDTYATGLGVSETHAESYLAAAEALAKTAVGNLPGLLQCDVAAKGEAACVTAFIAGFGERAFRRPLTPAEVARFQGFEAAARATTTLADAVRVTVEAFLLSPAFLYRVEFGQPGKAGDLVKPTSWEMASRISYVFAGSMPDAELFRAARADELQDPANVEKQARRLLASPRAKDTFARFADQWLELRAIETMQKTAGTFPGWDDSLKPLMKQEADLLVDSVVWNGNGDARALFSADYTFVNGPLAAFYGMQGVSGSAFVRVPVDATKRKGILTLPGVLASHAKPNETLPARRGKFVRTKLFCQPVGDPPPGAVAMAPQRTPGMTTRQFFTLIEQQPACGACHTTLDGVGFGLESYDAVGTWRTTDQGSPIDASGKLVGTDVDGTYSGGVDLANKVAGSDQVTACIARQVFRFAAGRPDTDADARSLAQLTARFRGAGYDLRELLVALTATDAFLLKPSLGVSP
jgi:Protein of unknown function (DUF1592)/Protein of unknown function (DUF1588)/Protein of unknown function (DUF1595)/Protein of unknown function (DUF1587)/Protein of unknown function (DUF1585)